MKETQENDPVVKLTPGDNERHESADTSDEARQAHSMEGQLQKVRHGLDRGALPVALGTKVNPRRSRRTSRKRPVEPQDKRSRDKDGKENFAFGNDNRPEHAQIAGLAEPEPIDNEAASQPE